MGTRERDPRVAQLLSLPWTVNVSRDDDNGFVARVAELPETIATGDTPEELETDFWESLKATIRARLALGTDIPRPHRVGPVPSAPLVVRVRQQDATQTYAVGGRAIV